MNEHDEHPFRRAGSRGRLFFGLALVALGLFLLLDQLAVIDIHFPWEWWPLILIALGVSRLLEPRDRRHRQGGVWLIIIGTWLILNFNHYFGLYWDNSWPLILVAAGGILVWRALAGDDGCSPRTELAETPGGGDEPAA